jgi:hypothetical protein
MIAASSFQADKFVPTIHSTKQAVLLDIVVYTLCCHPEFWICCDQSESLVFIHITLLLMSDYDYGKHITIFLHTWQFKF